MCSALQTGYGCSLLPPKINVLLNYFSVVLSLKYSFPILFFKISKIFKQHFFSFTEVKNLGSLLSTESMLLCGQVKMMFVVLL